jgi:hypothetical protein
MLRRPSVIAAAMLALSAALASAGTKYQSNLVPTSSTAPTLGNASKASLDDNEYVAVVHGTFVALNVAFHFNMPVELKKGNGSGKFSAASSSPCR